MHSLVVKVASTSALFLITFIAGLIPILLLRKRQQKDDARRARQDLRRKQWISLSTCFAGGAFFASCLLDLLPAVRSDFKAVFHDAKITRKFPVAEFSICIGFFFILTVEQMIHVFKDKAHHGHSHGHSPKTGLLNGTPSAYGTASQTCTPVHVERESGESDDDEPPSCSLDHHNSHHIDRQPNVTTSTSSEDDFLLEAALFSDISKKHHNHRHYLRCYLLLAALTIHALFEGLAIGLFQKINGMIQLLAALLIHKSVLAFSMGVSFVQHGFPKSVVVKSSLLFSAMSPVGLGIGILMLQYTSTNLGHVLSAIFQAISTGTFLYVTFFEIFFHEINSKECHKMLKVLMIVLGYSLIATVQYFQAEMD